MDVQIRINERFSKDKLSQEFELANMLHQFPKKKDLKTKKGGQSDISYHTFIFPHRNLLYLTHPVFIVRFHALKTAIHLILHRLPLKIVACFVRDKFSYSCLPSRIMHVFLVKGFFWIICRGPNTGCIAAFLKVLLSAAHSQCLCSCVFMVSCSF